MHRRARRTALLSLLTGGVVAAAIGASPPAANAAGAATCTQLGGGVLSMYVNYPAVVPILDLQLGGGQAAVSVVSSQIGECFTDGATEVRVSSASGFGAWRITDQSDFVNDQLNPFHVRFGDNDPVIVMPSTPGNAPVTWRSTGGSGIDLTGNGVADLTAETDYVSLKLLGTDQDDTIDLTGNGVAAFTGSFATVLGQAGDDTLLGGAGGDTLSGGAGDDDLRGWAGADVLYPDEGADSVFGRSPGGVTGDLVDGAGDTFVVDYDDDPDVLRGDGQDALEAVSFGGVLVSNGGTGDDGVAGEGDTYTGFTSVLTGGGSDVVETSGLTSLQTGEGNDTLLVGSSPDGLLADGGPGLDTLDLSQETGPTYGQLSSTGGSFSAPMSPSGQVTAFERMVGSSGSDEWVFSCACTSEPRGGADQVRFDTVDGGLFVAGPTADGADTVVADEVDATADYTQRSTALSLTLDAEPNDGAAGEGDLLDGFTTLLGGQAADTIVGDSQANVIDGTTGNDVLNGRGGDDVLRGDQGNDRLTGGNGDDRLLGSTGADTLLGGDGDDLLRGDTATDPTGGKDALDGGPGDDDEYGYAGNDTFLQGTASNGQDLLVGGAGTDLASYASRGSAVRLSLNGAYDDGASGEGDRLGGDIENLTGGRGADTVTGNALANLLTGGAGRDTLSGLGGNDTFQSLDGLVDSLLGGTGTDRAHRDRNDTVTSVEQRF